jgi:hypothetical protein
MKIYEEDENEVTGLTEKPNPITIDCSA